MAWFLEGLQRYLNGLLCGRIRPEEIDRLHGAAFGYRGNDHHIPEPGKRPPLWRAKTDQQRPCCTHAGMLADCHCYAECCFHRCCCSAKTRSACSLKATQGLSVKRSGRKPLPCCPSKGGGESAGSRRRPNMTSQQTETKALQKTL